MNTFTVVNVAVLIAAFSASTAVGQATRPVVQTVSPTVPVANRVYAIPGRTEAIESSTIFTRATGIVKERRFDIGDRVKAGDVLAVIDAPDVDRAVDRAAAAVDEAAARAADARRQFDRVASMVDSRAISQEEVDARRSTVDQTAAAVRLAEAERGRLIEQQGFATVRAPFDGVISGRNVDRGDRVRGDAAAAEEWLFRLVKLDRLRFVVAAPPDFAMQVNERTPVNVRFNERPGPPLTAAFDRSSGVFDQASGTMRVEFVLDNPTLAIPAGLTGTATLELPPTPDLFLVPTNALTFTRGNAALTVVSDGKVKPLSVAVGRNLGRDVEVRSSELGPQTRVVVNPNALLTPGTAVDEKEKGAAAAAR